MYIAQCRHTAGSLHTASTSTPRTLLACVDRGSIQSILSGDR